MLVETFEMGGRRWKEPSSVAQIKTYPEIFGDETMVFQSAKNVSDFSMAVSNPKQVLRKRPRDSSFLRA